MRRYYGQIRNLKVVCTCCKPSSPKKFQIDAQCFMMKPKSMSNLSFQLTIPPQDSLFS